MITIFWRAIIFALAATMPLSAVAWQDSTITQDSTLSEEMLNVEANIVAGVPDKTPKTKMTFSVGVVTNKALQPVPALSPEAALYGKVAGLKVVKGDGQPGIPASLLLRGPTRLEASGPLYIVDDVIIDPAIFGSPLTDIPADQIERIEVVKGAAGAAVYGSQGAHGVVRITTRRGQDSGLNQTRVIVRNEIGGSSLARKIKFNQHHGFKIAASAYVDANGMQVTPGDFIDRNGNWVDPRLPNRVLDTYRDPGVVPHAAGIAFYDKPYKYVATGVSDRNIPPQLLTTPFDQIDRFLDAGAFVGNTITLSRNMARTSFLINLGNRTEGGEVSGVAAFNRKNLRVNLDHQIRESLFFGVSGLYSHSQPDLTASSIFSSLAFTAPDVDLKARDENGRLFIQPDPASVQDNPLHFAENTKRDASRDRILGSLNWRWIPVTWFHVESRFGFDRSTRQTEWRREDIISRLVKSDISEKSWNAEVAGLFRQRFGDLTVKTKSQGLFQRAEFDFMQVEELGLGGSTIKFRSSGYAVITALDYKDRYIIDGLIRRDKNTLFGAQAKWQMHYRAGAAYRLTQEPWWFLPGVDEFKLRAA